MTTTRATAVRAAMGRSATAANATVSFVCRRTAMITVLRARAPAPSARSTRQPVRVGPTGAAGAVDGEIAQLGRDVEAGGADEQRHHAGVVEADGGGGGALQGGARGGGIDGGDERQRAERRLGRRRRGAAEEELGA